jgi:hypothetical protein
VPITTNVVSSNPLTRGVLDATYVNALKWQVVPTYGIQNDEVIYEAENANPLKAFLFGDLSHRIVVNIILQYQIRKECFFYI